MDYSKGLMWLDDTRIPYSTNDDERIGKNYHWASKAEPFGDAKTLLNKEGWDTKGRFTPNLLVSDDMLNDGNITKQSKRSYKPTENKTSLFGNSSQGYGEGIGDKGSSSRYYNLDIWFNKMIYGL